MPTFTKFKKCDGLKFMYAFLSVEVNGIVFDLLPFQFTKDNEKINCEFGKYQFCIESDKLKAIQLYPTIDKNAFVLENLEVYYSSNIDFESKEDEDAVIQEFVEYIKRNLNKL